MPGAGGQRIRKATGGLPGAIQRAINRISLRFKPQEKEHTVGVTQALSGCIWRRRRSQGGGGGVRFESREIQAASLESTTSRVRRHMAWRKASTMVGSNWVPEQRWISRRAASGGRLLR